MPSNFLLLINILTSSFIFISHSYNNKCLRHQEILLLQLRDELIFNSSLSTKLVRWNETVECCKWHGVECDASGHVVSLQLDDEGISGGIGDSSSLFRFKYLQKLNLAFNDFNYTDPIPKGIGKFTYLTHLNLSYAGFVGQVPVEISSLKRLVSLDISNYYCWTPGEYLSLEYPNLEMLVGNLTCLRELYLDCVNITSVDERKKWSHIISSYLPNITSLSLADCNLYGPLVRSFWKLHSLSILQLDYNDLSTVEVADLFASFPSLTTLTLHGCGLKGSIPSTFANLTKLIHVDLSYNSLTGSLSSTIFEGLPNLTMLDISGNSLSLDVGNFNSSLNLKDLGLGSCSLSNFPDFIKDLDLKYLDLSANSIGGEIPSWIWGTQLKDLDLSFNLLTDFQKPYHIPASLVSLSLKSNQLRGELHLPIPLESQLWWLSVANNSLSGSIPTSICKATHLDYLSLSKNKLSGSITPCLLENIYWLDLNQNKINGSIPDIFSLDCKLQSLVLNNNNLEGKIPKSLKSCMSLEFMDVGNNNINDTFPCMLSSSLSILILHSNRFHGEVTCNTTWSMLRIVDISLNDFSGRLESINFSSWRGMMQWRDAEWYMFGVTLIMKGIELELDMIWPKFGSIDFSCNNFIGEIPNAIGDLTTLHHLNLSHNSLNGSIPQSFGHLSELESLDLSVNKLTEPIPKELGELTFLEVMNLSYNKLVGEIPKGRQIQTFSVKSFEGNPGLCGFPLNTNCTHNDELSPREHEDVEEKREIEWEYVSAALGYVVGFGSIAWLLLFCRSFRHKFFGKVDEIIEEVFDARDRRRKRARMAARNRVRRH